MEKKKEKKLEQKIEEIIEGYYTPLSLDYEGSEKQTEGRKFLSTRKIPLNQEDSQKEYSPLITGYKKYNEEK